VAITRFSDMISEQPDPNHFKIF